MKAIKPQKLAILTRCYEHRRTFHFGASVLAFVPLGDEPSLLPEAEMWKLSASELGDEILEAGIAKRTAEFLVTGRAFASGGQPTPTCEVRARLGTREKTLLVSGDRRWIEDDREEGHDRSTEPEPFTELPLDWKHAFGGEGFDANPRGKGAVPLTTDEQPIHPLPNIEYPDQRVERRDKSPEPAGFGPIDVTWPQRAAKAGSYDDPWLEEDYPGYARDVDWRYFNLATEDQQFDGPLNGDEPYRLENMHPEKPCIEGRLPGFAARCFVNRRTRQGEQFQEIPTRLTTAWFFPHAERAVLIFQGSIEVAEEDAADVLQVVVGAERIGEDKGVEHYRAVLAQRLDEEKGHLFAMRDQDLLPVGLASAPDEEQPDMPKDEGLLKQNLRRKAEKQIEEARGQLVALGLDPDAYGPQSLEPEEPLPDLEDLPAFVEQLEATAEAKKADLLARKEQCLQELREMCAEHGADLDDVIGADQKLTGPPKSAAAAQIQELEGMVAGLRAQGEPTGELDAILAGLPGMMGNAEERAKETYLLTAHHQDPAPPMPPEQASSVRASIEQGQADGESFAGRDLTGCDLSGLDLRGADFEGAWLERANLEGTNLEGAKLGHAVLAHGSLKGARLSGAVFEGANLGKAQLQAAQADGADLREAILAKADLSGANLRGARLQEADLMEAVFAGTDLSEVDARESLFMETDLSGVRLCSAKLDRCIFIKGDVSEVDFSGASLEGATFLGIEGKGAYFRKANLTNARFVQDSAFESSDFAGARLERANLRGTRLSECDLSEANLQGADLSECDLRNAHLPRVLARGARLAKAELSHAELTSANLMGAVLQRSELCGADVRGANLFQADLARIHTNEDTQLEGANMKKARVHPRRTE